MKVISITAFIWVLAQTPAPAQWYGAASPAPIVASTPIPTMSGILRTIVLRDRVDLEITATVRRTFRLAKVLVVVEPNGNVVDASTMAVGQTITVHLMQDGSELIIDRIFLQ
jgi:hypothetical protein